MEHAGSTERTRLRRLPEKAAFDRAVVHRILDAGRVAHVALVGDGSGRKAGLPGLDDPSQPYVLPVAYARDGDRVLFHGSTGSRLFRALAGGAPTCFTVTLLDGLVLARSAFESSMNYRSVMVLGRCTALAAADKFAALETVSEHLMPGRWADVRPPAAKELAATMVLALPLDECSAKVSTGGPTDDPADLDRPTWAGVVPIRTVLDPPVAAADLQVPAPVPGYVEDWE
jgi:uncharacterized protein